MPATSTAIDWADFVKKSLAGEALSRVEAQTILDIDDSQVLTALQAAYQVRQVTFGNRVKVCLLQNARSGLCPEDCGYCSQSNISKAPIEKYGMLSEEELLEGARKAKEAGAKRYCMVTSARGPSKHDIDHLCQVTRNIKSKYDLEICVSLGILDQPQAEQLKDSGVGWVNHNLNTSERFYPEICSTHTYQDRINTVQAVQKAGMMTCSGGIIGMGETDQDLLDFAYAARELKLDSIPINFLHPIKGTPLEGSARLKPMKCLKVLCLFRFLNPKSEIRAAGGREVNLRALQPLALYAANSIFVEGYLTTSGQKMEEAHQMIKDMGFEIESTESVV